MNKSKLLLALFAQLERENVVSIPQSARLYAETERRVREALEQLVFCYDAVGTRLELHENHARLVRRGTEQVLRLTREESDVLLQLLAAQGYGPEGPLAAKLLAAKGYLAGEGPAPLIAALPQPAAGEVLGVLATACEDEEHHHLRILYRKDATAQPEERVVEPWAITADGERRYLQAWCPRAQAWRTFRTDRILAAEQLPTRFTPRADTPRPGAIPHGSPQTALVALAPGSRLPDWPGLTHAGTAEDGRTLVSVPWFGTPWLPRQIVSCFGTAQPLQPPELVEATKAYAQELLESC